MSDNPPTPNLSSTPRTNFNAIGIVVLVLGLAIAAIIYWAGQPHSTPQSNAAGDWQDSTLSIQDSKASARDVELYNGKMGMLALNLEDWFQQPTSWAILIATISILTSVACFRLARQPM